MKSDLTHTHKRHLRCWFTLDSLADKLLSCCTWVHNAPVCVCLCMCAYARMHVCHHITRTNFSVGRQTLDDTPVTPEEAQMKGHM